MEESRSRAVQKALSKPGAKVISPLVRVEFFSALSRRVRMKEYPVEVAREMADQFRQHVSRGFFHFASITSADYQLAEDWIAQFDTSLRILDALHLATVFHGGCTLITADKTLAVSAEKLGVSVHKI
ncbi:MAG: type II toxin-antitoxin system VapC family toxin [Phycisphaerae bacterium]|nr:type II toxin-antitoxin system VapC family toxin [Phycisphaerae bacterium]